MSFEPQHTYVAHGWKKTYKLKEVDKWIHVVYVTNTNFDSSFSSLLTLVTNHVYTNNHNHTTTATTRENQDTFLFLFAEIDRIGTCGARSWQCP